jgi:perosamine synthetase
MAFKYPVYTPYLKGNEKKYVDDCLDSTWISSKGKYIQLFEQKFAEFIGVNHATTVNNGTVALHLALLSLDIKPGDEIIVPSFTYIASVNAITYMNAVPVFVDSLQRNWQMDPEDVGRKITPKTKAVMVVHLYGHSCDMDAILAICNEHKLLLIEDCAEAIGSRYKGKHVGGFGDIATFSFYGNKTITTGEGGMVVSNHEKYINLAYYLKNQGVSSIQYWHDMIGYNYRMTNICAAIGLAQLEQIQDILKIKKTIAQTYREIFRNTEIEFHTEDIDVENFYWMCSCLVKSAEQREPLREFLQSHGIETRPLFHPVHAMPMYHHLTSEKFPVIDDVSARGINLPSYPELTLDDVRFIANKVVEFVKHDE